uniref:Zinc knuckle family protein n=2 Tax=Oryza sativa subsp. japonica TaxID=39947 RepID=Q75HF5_ORYSJ|nr:hypothetical protein [Oryza sativa Japonica Group]ABF99528.1 Zinc knuckle family protein [Oryza sativa Japonica Group]
MANKFSTKPHVFDGTDFAFWCDKMQSYIMAEYYDVWQKVAQPYEIPEQIDTVALKTEFNNNCKAHFSSLLNGLDMSIWEMKVTSIQESVDMSTLTLDSLYTKLKTHEMNILTRKVDSNSSALVSSLTSLNVGVSSSSSTVFALFNAMFDEQLKQFEEDLVLVSNRFFRAMNNVRNRKRGGPNRCFECGALDHLRSYCPKLGRSKKEDNGRVKEDEVDKKKMTKEKKKNCMQMLIQELIRVFDESEDEDESKGKQVVDLAFIACNANSDVDESDSDSEEKLSYDQLERAAYKFAEKL